MSDDQIFTAIHAIENQIASLEKIENKPKKLLAKIDSLKENIKQLIDIVDARL